MNAAVKIEIYVTTPELMALSGYGSLSTFNRAKKDGKLLDPVVTEARPQLYSTSKVVQWLRDTGRDVPKWLLNRMNGISPTCTPIAQQDRATAS